MSSLLLRRMYHWGLIVAFFCLPGLWSRLTPNQYSGGRSAAKDAGTIRNASAIGRMLGEFRTSMSDMIMLKTEAYLHGGVQYVVHGIDPESGTCDGHQAESLIPSPKSDYRGWIGKMEREIKPWYPEGKHAAHSDGRQLLPWFRLATLSDHTHLHAYTSGGYWLFQHNYEESIAYLEEGLVHNPDAFQLYLTLGQVRLKQLRKEIPNLFDPTDQEIEQLMAVQKIYLKAAELALAQRPDHHDHTHSGWGHTDEVDAWTAFRMSVILEQTYGSPEEAYRLAGRFLELEGEDERLQETYNNLKLELGK
ncbi:hypothetical protein P0Y35_10855 [Kiritimatiellaeota bacterium B1221]|nr:hypothetical protein [Kiritimatiellaeota bacterium B1221]